MTLALQVLKLCAGIGLFLFAMYLLEDALKNLSGRKFKQFLQRVTRYSLSAVGGGAAVTAILQSSSMVSFMVLAFVGAGVFTMKNALAVILGANLGTTIDSWMVATLGFKTNIEVIAYPAVFVAGLLIILAGKRMYIAHTARFLFGFGLLFIGLSFMKTAMESQVNAFDFSAYAHMPLAVFLGIGFVVTLLVQSSSITMALTLTALHAGVLEFPAAVAMVLGSETGTTIKTLLSAVGGTAAKKRVVLGNLLFNIVLTLVAFVFIRPIITLITGGLNITDPLIGLVTFSTLVNLASIMLFLPLLNPFVRFLELFFRDTDAGASAFIGNAEAKEPETALELFKMETAWFLHNTMLFNLGLLQLPAVAMPGEPAYRELNDRKKFTQKTTDEQYVFLKQQQGEMQLFYLALRPSLTGEAYGALTRLAAAARNGIHAAKQMNDIRTNITNLRHSSKNIKFELFEARRQQTEAFYVQLSKLLMQPGVSAAATELLAASAEIQHNYEHALTGFYTDAPQAPLEGLDLTTVINFNRGLSASNNALLLAINDYLPENMQQA
jgi:phosphate:Na+ symporter